MHNYALALVYIFEKVIFVYIFNYYKLKFIYKILS